MAHKFRRVLAPSRLHLYEEIHDFVVNDLGWTDETPTGQDDELGVANGFLMRSEGEDGNKDICVHLKVLPEVTVTGTVVGNKQVPAFTYLTAAISSTSQMTCTVRDDTRLDLITKPVLVRIDDELLLVSVMTGNVLTISQRGINGTTRATHAIGAQVAATDLVLEGEVFGARDLSVNLRETTSGVIVDYTQCGISEFAGEAADRYSYGYTFLKDRASGKMRLVYDYNEATGAFTYGDFKDYIGGPNQVDLVSVGFHPAWSIRGSSHHNSVYFYARGSMVPGTDAFLYGSKDGFYVLIKKGENYWVNYYGSYVPHVASETTVITSALSAGATAIPVSDRRLFMPGGKYRIIATDGEDWVDNEDRSGEGWPDLDPEEGVCEEFVVDTITPGAGNEGTLVLLSGPLRYSYHAGSKPAVIGECPRPTCRSIGFTYWYFSDINFCHLFGGRSWWGAMDCYRPAAANDLSGHASHRQSWRTYHALGAPQTPFNGAAQMVRKLMKVYELSNPRGDQDTVMYGMVPNYLTDRYLYIVPTFGNFDFASRETYYPYGVFPSIRGTLPGLWFQANLSQIVGGNEDVVYARWLGKYEKFRMFQTFSNSVANARWILLGPEL